MHLPEPDLDDEILNLLAQGDRDAINKMHQLYYEKLLHGVRKFIRDPHVASSLVNDLLIAIWEKTDTVEPHKPLLHYLYRAVRNRVMNYLRNQNRLRVKEIPMQDDLLIACHEPDGMSADDTLLKEDLMLLWSIAEFKMGYRMRQAFLMFNHEGKTKEEIATHMNITVNAVEKNIARAWRVIDKIRQQYFMLVFGTLILI